MKDVKLTDFSDEELVRRLSAIKMQEARERTKAMQQFLYQCSADSILAELRKRQGEKEQYEKEKRAEENEKTIHLIIAIIFCTLVFLCAFLCINV